MRARPTTALNMSKSLLDNSDKDRPVHFALGNMYTRLRRWKEAEDELTKATPWPPKRKTRSTCSF